MQILSLLADVLAPPGCAACDRPGVRVFCEACAATNEAARRPDAAYVYGGAIADAIVRFKFEKRPDLIARFAPAMVENARLLPIDVVVPVPLHPERLVARGYNQAALLARPIARELEKPLAPRALVRVRNTPMQSTLGRSERLANLAAAFVVPGFKAVRGRRVLLVDDVRTTGATLGACAAALHEVGAARVFPLVLACSDGSAL